MNVHSHENVHHYSRSFLVEKRMDGTGSPGPMGSWNTHGAVMLGEPQALRWLQLSQAEI